METEAASTSREITVASPKDLVRQSTDVAGLCREIVTRTALKIQDRKFVRVEGWQSIATAHGCVAGAKDVERIDGGFRAIGEIRRMSDGALLATAEGFVGEDEPTWFGGEQITRNGKRTLPKRPDYAIRAMAQTRAISRVCRSAFAHCVVLMDAGLSTTPAEEADFMHDDQHIEARQERRESEAAQNAAANGQGRPASTFQEAKRVMTAPEDEQPVEWRDIPVHFGKNKGLALGELNSKQLEWYANDWMQKKQEDSRPPSPEDNRLINALNAYKRHRIREMTEQGSDPKLRELQEARAQDADADALPF